MRTQLQNSMRVKLDRFGTFKLGISTTSAEKAKDFTPGANIKGIHVLFQPELKIDAKGNRIQSFIYGAKVQEALPYDIEKEPETEENV